jgi:hypothetical protein
VQSWNKGKFLGTQMNNINTWLATTPGHFNVFSTTMPWGGYGVQQGHWLVGEFTQPGGLGADLIHICCTNAANIWKSAGNGSFSVINGWSPWPNYGMVDGSWHAADFTGDGRTDVLHAWGAASSNIWQPRPDNTGTFNVNGSSPGRGYCMLC